MRNSHISQLVAQLLSLLLISYKKYETYISFVTFVDKLQEYETCRFYVSLIGIMYDSLIFCTCFWVISVNILDNGILSYYFIYRIEYMFNKMVLIMFTT